MVAGSRIRRCADVRRPNEDDADDYPRDPGRHRRGAGPGFDGNALRGDPIQATINEDLKAASTTIVNDDEDTGGLPPPELSIRAISAHNDEGDEGEQTPSTFLVERTGDAANLDQVTTVIWTATPTDPNWVESDDFVLGQPTSGVLTFEAGDTDPQEITLMVQGDLEVEKRTNV